MYFETRLQVVDSAAARSFGEGQGVATASAIHKTRPHAKRGLESLARPELYQNHGRAPR